MCTASWIVHGPGDEGPGEGPGYELFFNRDELRTRAAAAPPCRVESGGVAFLAPRDGDAGGSWLAVNEFGLTLALLNRYEAEVGRPAGGRPAGREPRSRGLLLVDLASSATVEEAASRLLAPSFGVEPRYRPFTLLLLEPGVEPRVLAWDGRELRRLSGAAPPLASSSYDPEGIGDARRATWRELVAAGAGAEAVLAFHRSHHPERGPYSPCMHRADARTVSFAHLRVTPESVAIAYADGPPCTAALSPPITLARRPVAAGAGLRHAGVLA